MKHELLLFLYYQHKPIQVILFILTFISFMSMMVHLIRIDVESDFRPNQDKISYCKQMAKLSAITFIFLLLIHAIFPTRELLHHLLTSPSYPAIHKQ